MGPFEMVVAIVIVVTIGGIVKSRMQRSDEAAPAVDTADAARMREEIRSLRERVQVLERVITDNHSSSSLDREIERLRGDQAK
ncbi:hypothetical protein ACPVPU_11590 [Sphingomonas sp. CJ99]